jgi:hypothetical protein
MIEEWEYPKRCLYCNETEVKRPELLCKTCRNIPNAHKTEDRFYRIYDAGNVRGVSGGLPSLGKRR